MVNESEIKHDLAEDRGRLASLTKKKDPASLKSRLAELRVISNGPSFWGNNENAQVVMKEIGAIEDDLKEITELETKISDIDVMISVVDDPENTPGKPDPETWEEIKTMLQEFETMLKKAETKTFLGGKYDSYDAILSIHAGQGGTEANDWAEMLFRMYLRYLEKQGYKTEITNKIAGNEAGINTATIEIRGRYAFGYLKREHGTHRLVRVSPFNAQGLRQTSFAGVEVVPLIEDDLDVNLKA